MKTAAEYRAMADECFKWAREARADEILMHWRRFCACLKALPAEQAEHVRRIVSVEMAALRR